MGRTAIDLEKKSRELKDLVSQFQTPMFLGDISAMMQLISAKQTSKSLDGLSSPLRQLYYIAGLNVTSNANPEVPLRPQFSQEEWEKMKILLNEIEKGYEQIFYSNHENEVDEDWIARRMVSMPTFLSFFNQGPLNYEEQVIERITSYFTPFDSEIQRKFGISVNDFLSIYEFIDSLPNKFLNEKINRKEGQQSWKEFASSMIDKGLRPEQWKEHLPERFKELFQFMYDKGRMLRFSLEQIAENFGDDKAEKFLQALTWQRAETNFLYYTEPNVLHSKPIFQIDDKSFQCIELKQVLHAIFNILFEFCTSESKLKDKYYAIRGDKFEDSIERIFQNFFNSKATVYRSFYTDTGHEQDLLFLIGDLALIVEAKSSKRKEPRRDPDKAYPLILSNFEEVIQKGYDQAYRVKEKFIEKKILQIYSDIELKNHLADIDTKKYRHVFSIIVTLERFGQIQVDLNELLEIWDDDTFPWSVCLDDLETFLLALRKLKKGIQELIQFLHLREKLHGKLICGDELEVCGAFINRKIDYKMAMKNKILFMAPDLSDVFDRLYLKGGLGFDNERNMHYKTDDRYHIIGR